MVPTKSPIFYIFGTDKKLCYDFYLKKKTMLFVFQNQI